MASYCKLLTINLRISPDIEDHVIKNTPDSMILKSEISPKTFEILKKVKSHTGFFGVADPLDKLMVQAALKVGSWVCFEKNEEKDVFF